MRIIAGSMKGRRLFTPSDQKIRPTSDKVKESIFNIIADHLEDAVAIDLFCGTGNLGLEAISRGVKKCYFVDNARESIKLTEKNIGHCRAEASAAVLCMDFARALSRLGSERINADIVFLDPPYGAGLIEACIEAIAETGVLASDGIIVAEHGPEVVLPEQLGPFDQFKHKRYGKIIIDIYGKTTEE